MMNSILIFYFVSLILSFPFLVRFNIKRLKKQ
jgi:hypothetical protein